MKLTPDGLREYLARPTIAGKKRHESLAGSVRLHFSETQQVQIAEAFKHIWQDGHTPPEARGADISLDVNTGKVHIFTEVETLEGDAYAHDQEISPCGTERWWKHGLVTEFTEHADVREVATADPRDLLPLWHFGHQTMHSFRGNPEGRSLTALYGEEKAKQIVQMIATLPEALKCKLFHDESERHKVEHDALQLLCALDDS